MKSKVTKRILSVKNSENIKIIVCFHGYNRFDDVSLVIAISKAA